MIAPSSYDVTFDIEARNIALNSVFSQKNKPVLAPLNRYGGKASPKRVRGHFAQYCNQQCQESADSGHVADAESWMQKICAGGLEPQLDSLNALLKAWAKAGELEKAEEWFAKVASPALHPELCMIELDANSYNIMALAFAEKGDIVRAERYVQEMKSHHFKFNNRGYTAMVRACLQRGDARRAHSWCQEMIDAGFRKPNKATMASLVRALADAGNAASANKWLGYMAELNQRLDKQTYEYVRGKAPGEIVPSQLSGEAWKPAGPEVKPATLNGEGERLRTGYTMWRSDGLKSARTPRHHLFTPRSPRGGPISRPMTSSVLAYRPMPIGERPSTTPAAPAALTAPAMLMSPVAPQVV